jgi:hypothetical protein
MILRQHPAVRRFVDAAGRFRDALHPPVAGAFARELLDALSTLVAAAAQLPDVDLPEEDVLPLREFEVSHEAWHRLYRAVPAWLDARGLYHMHFTPLAIDADGRPVFGHLGDDIGDVYRDVMAGLRAWETGCAAYDAEIVWNWRFAFETHWGRHAVHAITALYELTVR